MTKEKANHRFMTASMPTIPSRDNFKKLAVSSPKQLMAWMTNLENPDVAIAAEYLGTFSEVSESVSHFLAELTRHEDNYVRERAVYGLAHQDTSIAKACLVKLAKEDTSKYVREAAYEALELLED